MKSRSNFNPARIPEAAAVGCVGFAYGGWAGVDGRTIACPYANQSRCFIGSQPIKYIFCKDSL